jgi:hypothetical protein
MKKERQVSTDKQTERFFFICNLTSTYHPIQVGSYAMSEGSVAPTPEYPPEQQIGSIRPTRASHPFKAREPSRSTSTEAKEEYKKPSQLSSAEGMGWSEG